MNRLPVFQTSALVAALIAPSLSAKTVWESDFEGGLTSPADIDFNGDGVRDGVFPNSSGNDVEIAATSGIDGSPTNALRLAANNTNPAQFRIGQQVSSTSVPIDAFENFTVNDTDDFFDFTRFRVTAYQRVDSASKGTVFGSGISVRQGGTPAGANLVNVAFNTQVGAGDDQFSEPNAFFEQDGTLSYGYSVGRAPGDAVPSNANDFYGAVDPIGLTLANPTEDRNGDGNLRLPPQQVLYMQDQSRQSGLNGPPFLPNDPAVVTDAWYDFGKRSITDATENNTDGWVRLDLLIDADPDRVADTDVNAFSVHLTHVGSGAEVFETHQIFSDDVNLNGGDNTFTFITFRHLDGSPGTESFMDDVSVQALLYGDINGDDTFDAGDIDAMYGLIGGDVTNVDAQLADLNYDGTLGNQPQAANGSAALSDLDELVFNVLGSLYGDANLSGSVEQADLDAVLANWGRSGDVGWATGDLNGNGAVEQGDLDQVLGNWGSVATPDFSAWPVSVPEPASMAAIGLLTMLMRRRRDRLPRIS